MDKQQFTKCFEDWLALKPFKRRDWPNSIAPIYYNHLGDYRPVELSEALNALAGKTADWPTIPQIKQEINLRASNQADNAPAAASNVYQMTAMRLAEKKLGFPVAVVGEYPEWVSVIVDKAVESALKEVDRLIDEGYISTDAALRCQLEYASSGINILMNRERRT